MKKLFLVFFTFFATVFLFVSVATFALTLHLRNSDRSSTESSKILNAGEYATISKMSDNEEDPNLTLPLYDNR
jgi:CHASE3 domain sensor protein